MNVIQIGLEGMQFFAHHGCYPGEREQGNWFELNLQVTVPENEAAHTDELRATTDYGLMYQICREEMEINRNLLESVSWHIAHRILSEFPEVLEVDLKVGKKNPPVVGEVKESWVRRVLKRE